LILAGTDDPIIPLVNARIMRRLIPDATLHTYDDGHLGLVTQAHELAPVVTAFLLDQPLTLVKPVNSSGSRETS
jgi:pimeloyl-ACP methyl ester carboxylesterase